MVLHYFFDNKAHFSFLKKISNKRLLYCFLGVTFLYDIMLTVTQYLVWKAAPFTRFFLPPYQSWKYFMGYTFIHIWISHLLVFVVAFLFFALLKILKKYKDEVISASDLSLALLASLILGWPKIIIYIPLFLALALLDSVFNLIVYKRQRIALTLPLLLAALIVFFFGNYLLGFFKLSILVM
jgi:asparagine N-glycosylation enzyme membrane subunit Stt3